jgi:CRISPR-associated protein Cmr1
VARGLDGVSQETLGHWHALADGALPGKVTWKAEIELISPVYGGGAEPGRFDEDRPFRGPAIRGQLRFWWRATQGAALVRPGSREDYGRLRACEAAIWGMSTVARDPGVRGNEDGGANAPLVSAVSVRIGPSSGRVTQRVVGGDRVPLNSGHGYVYFPARETRGQNARPAGSYWWGPKAALELVLDPVQLAENLSHLDAFPDAAAREAFIADAPRQVAAALWAWANFGGIGARTRRGAGAFQLRNVQGPDAELVAPGGASAPELRQRLAAGAQRFVRGDPNYDGDFPVLKQATIAVAPLQLGPKQVRGRTETVTLDEPERVVSGVGMILQNFRQGVPFARNPGQGPRPGRSRWPEPDAIRRLLGQFAHDHAPRLPMFFPRAAFGLPIVVKFNTSEPSSRGDPQGQVTIRPARFERLASPVILRPVRLSGDPGYAVVCVLLNTLVEPEGGMVLEYNGRTIPIPAQAMPVAGATREHVGAVQPMGNVPHAHVALMMRVAGQPNGGRFQA